MGKTYKKNGNSHHGNGRWNRQGPKRQSPEIYVPPAGSFGDVLAQARKEPIPSRDTVTNPPYLAFPAKEALGLNGSFSIHRSFPRVNIKTEGKRVVFTVNGRNVFGDDTTTILIKPNGYVEFIRGYQCPIKSAVARIRLMRSFEETNREVQLLPGQWALVLDYRGQESLMIEEARIHSGIAVLICEGADRDRPFISSIISRLNLEPRRQEMVTEFIARHTQHLQIVVTNGLWESHRKLVRPAEPQLTSAA